MPEEIEIGKLIIGLRVVAGNALETLNAAKSTMKGMAQVGSKTQKSMKVVSEAIKDTAKSGEILNTAADDSEKHLDALVKKALEGEKVLSNVGKQTDGLDNYSDKVEGLNEKCEVQKKEIDKLDNSLNKVKSNYTEVGKSAAQSEKAVGTTFAQAEKQIDAVNKKAAETNKVFSVIGMQTEPVEKFTAKIENLTAKYELQKQKVNELSFNLDSIVEQYAKMEMSVGRSGEVDPEKINPQLTQQLDAEIAKMDDLKSQIALTQQAREEAANRAALSAQKQAEAAEKAAEREEKAMMKVDERQKRADSTLALSSVGMMLNTISNSCDGTASKLSFVATQVVFLKQALNAAAGPAAKLGVGIAGGLGIAISVITMLASEAQRVREESIKSAAEAAQAYATSDKEIKTLEKNIQVLESYSSTTEEVKKAKQELAQMSPSMIAGYDKEGEAVLKTVEALRKELEYRKLLADEKLNFASDSAEINVEQYYENAEKLEAATRLMKDSYNDYEWVIDGMQEQRESKQKKKDLMDVYGFANISFSWGNKDAAAFGEKAQEFADNRTQKLETAINSIRARITKLCEGDTTISDALSDSFFRTVLDNKEIDSSNIDASAQAIIAQYDQISAKVDEGLRNQIFDNNTAPEIANAFREKIEGAFGLVGTELEQKIKDIQEEMKVLLSGDIMGDVEAFKNLGEKITGGEATIAEMNTYDTLLQKIRKTCTDSATSFRSLTNASKSTASQLRRAAAEAKGATSSYTDLAKGTSDLFSSYKNLNKEMSDINVMKAVIKTLKEGKSSKSYGDALAYVADMYGVTKDKAAGMLGTLEAETQAKETLAAANVMLTQAEIVSQVVALESAKSQEIAMNGADSATAKSIQNMINNLATLQLKMAETFNFDGTPKISADLSKIKIPTSGGSKKSGGGGGSKQNTALDNELKRLEHKKALDDLTYSEELAWLERIRSKYAKTAEEKQELDEKVYSAKKALLEAEREHAKNMDQLTLQEEIKSLESQMRLYRSGTQARMELEEQLYQAKKDLERQVYDLNVYYGKLNLEEQAKQIEKMISKYKEGTQARIDLEKELYDIQKQIKERDAQSIDKVAEGITEALRNRYEQQRDAEQQRIEDSKKSWQEWSDAQVKAIQDQMDALDDLTKQEDQAEEERKRRRKISAMEQAIKYEFDDYNRQKLEEQLETAKKDLDDYLTKIDRDKQKEALREEQDRIKEQAEKEQELLDDEWEAKSKEYEEFLKEFNLKAEAEKMLMKGNQEEILDIIKSYAPEYDMVGQTLGEKLVDGFSSKVKDIQAWIDSLTEPIREQQRLMAIVATEAADNFMRRQQEREAANRVQVIEHKPQISLVVNVNKEISTPSELRNELERMLENMSDM